MTYLLAIVGALLLVLLALIALQGRNHRKIGRLLEELEELKARQREQSALQQRIAQQMPPKLQSPRASQANRLARWQYPGKAQDDRQQAAIRAQINRKPQKPGLIRRLDEKFGVLEYLGEQFIGGNLFNKLGMALLVLGVAYFVRYAIEKDWIDTVGRVAVGLGASGLLVLLAHLASRRMRAFSSVLLGGSIAVLFYTFFIGFEQYKLFSPTAGLLILLGINAFSVSLALAYDRMEVAVFSTLAAFTAPLMVDFNGIPHTVLLTYLLVVDIALLVLAYFKKWMVITAVSYVGSLAFYGLWLRGAFQVDQVPYLAAFVFATFFYLITFTMVVLNNVRERRPFIPLELTMIITLTIMYFTAGLAIIEEVNNDLKGLFTALIALINFIHLMVLFRNENADRKLIYLLLGLVVLFTSLVPPVQLVGKTITLVWSLQIVLMMWLAQKIDVVLMKLGSFAMTLAMLGSLGMDMWQIYVRTTELAEPMAVIFNRGFLINMVAVSALATNLSLLKNEKGEYFAPFLKVKMMKAFLGAAAGLAFYFTGFLELKYHVIQSIDYRPSVSQVVGAYNLGLLFLASIPALLKRDIPALGAAAGGAMFLSSLLYLFFYNYKIILVRNAYLMSNDASLGQYQFHYALVAAVAFMAVSGWLGLVRFKGAASLPGRVGAWWAFFVLLFMLSAEADNHYVVAEFREGFLPAHIQREVHQTVYTVLWSGVSLLAMWLGMAFGYQELRRLALTLLGATFLKLAVLDLGRIDEHAQVVSFVTLGATATLVSYLYQRQRLRAQAEAEALSARRWQEDEP